MKRIITVLFATGLLAALATGCKEEYKTYSDAEYVLFADTLATYAVPVSYTHLGVRPGHPGTGSRPDGPFQFG